MSREKKIQSSPSERSRSRWLNHFALALLAALVSHSSSIIVYAQPRLVKLDPEPVVVQLQNGQGTADVNLALAQGAAVPAFTWTSANGTSNSIPANNISFSWATSESSSQSGTQQTLLVGRLTVDARVSIEPDTNYAGRLIFYWSDATAPVLVNFNASDRAKLAFSVTPTKVELALVQFQPDTMLIRVKNTGRIAINSLSVSSSDLLDSETQRRLVLPEQIKDFGATPLAPAHEAEFPFKVPPTIWAGTYVGSLDVVANRREHQSIAFTLRTRGPTPARNTYWIPFILFVGTLLLGYGLSTILENWFNLGGLLRAEAQRSLQKSERELKRIAQQVEEWGANRPPEVFAKTRIRLQQNLNELLKLSGRIPDLTNDELVAEGKRFALAATLLGIFESAVNVALAQWPTDPPKLNQVLTALDDVDTGTEPNTYRNSLRAVLENQSRLEIQAGANRVFNAKMSLPDMPSPAQIEKRIKRMVQLERAVAALVVFIMAYQLFYARDFAFGTLLDYLGVFLWSLGLTQMGTQLIARARSSFTPAQ
jgi:hypothetical protein